MYNGIVNLRVMPSMRALMSAGPALSRDNIAGFNCSYLPVDNVRSFDECMYILLCGCGVGFSVERQYVSKLPEVPEELYPTESCVVVQDSKIGWATAYREVLGLLYSGKIPKWDVSKVRPAGSRLKTFGGRASGPAPLEDLFRFTIKVFDKAKGRKLSSLEVHDIICKIADIVVVGGVRRSALISLSNLTDERMQRAKVGNFWETDAQRALANNSVAYTEKPDMGIFMREWQTLYESKAGERGIFNRTSARKQSEATGRREFAGIDFGTNPCGEIILRPNGLCNLSEVIVRAEDSLESLKDKVKLATVLGTFQSTLTDYRYVRKVWRSNAEEERLLGVSLTGIMDHAGLSGKEWTGGALSHYLEELKNVAIETNKEWAERLGINPSAAITTIKPSGTVSQLVDSSSGIHPRHSHYYIRTVRADKKDPLAVFMRSMGFPVEDDITKPEWNDVFSFPVKAPESSVTRFGVSAIQQLNHYLTFKRHWCEHNPSITVYVKEHEWMKVGAWVYEHFDEIGGIAFLPYDGGNYLQAPYQECTDNEYQSFLAKMPIGTDWSMFVEKEDNTTGTQELNCMAGVCEIN